MDTYKKQLKAFDMKRINVLAVALTFIFIAGGIAAKYFALDGFGSIHFWDIAVIILGFVALTVLHELLHGLAFLICGSKLKDIRFGFSLKNMIAYCNSKAPLTARKYRFVLILPSLIVGLIPLIVSVFFLNAFYIVMFAAMLAGGAGDFVMLASTFKLDPKQLILDHPFAPAYYVLYDIDALPSDFIEVTEEDEQKLKEQFGAKK